MKSEIKAEWVAALRSGEYKQGREYLRNEDDTYCCLGVLCDLAARAGVGQWSAGRRFIVGPEEGLALPPAAVAEWAGIEGQTPYVVVIAGGEGEALPALNDTGTSFEEIADLIESQF